MSADPATSSPDPLAPERAALAARLGTLRRLENLPLLVAGVVHDLNNTLMGVLGSAAVAKDLPGLDPAVVARLEMIEAAALESGRLCTRLQALIGRRRPEPAPRDLNALVLWTVRLARKRVPPHIQVSTHFEDALPRVLIEPDVLDHVLLNLVANAVEALGATGGRITVTTRRTPSPDEVCVTVADDGPGLAAELAGRLFEPFASTRGPLRGFGLALSRTLLREQRGDLVARLPGGEPGATFDVLLPVAAHPGESVSPPTEPPTSAATTTVAGSPTAAAPRRPHALVVDDELIIREIICQMVTMEKIVPLAAATGTEALQLFEQHRDEIDLVLLDLTLPGVPSDKIMEAIRASGRAVRIVLMSGYSHGEVMDRCGMFNPDGFLSKPFTVGDLNAVLRASRPTG